MAGPAPGRRHRYADSWCPPILPVTTKPGLPICVQSKPWIGSNRLWIAKAAPCVVWSARSRRPRPCSDSMCGPGRSQGWRSTRRPPCLATSNSGGSCFAGRSLKSARTCSNLCKKHRPSLAAFVTFYVDFVSHRFWRFRSPPPAGASDWLDLRFKDAVDQSYVEFDKIVGRLVAAAGSDSTIAVVSEHGMEPEPNSAELGSSYFSIRGRRIHELLGLDPGVLTCAVARWIAFRPMEADQVRVTATKLRNIMVVETGLPYFKCMSMARK